LKVKNLMTSLSRTNKKNEARFKNECKTIYLINNTDYPKGYPMEKIGLAEALEIVNTIFTIY
jgi:hypothetical protein